MRSNFKVIAFAFSLVFNGLFIVLLVLIAALKSTNMDSFSFPAAEDGYAASATIAVFPTSCELVFNPIEIALQPTQKFFIQYSILVSREQSNIVLNALYDPNIISVEYTGAGITITALREGETLMQYISNAGIKNLVQVTVTK
jgi:hypothetical protein